MMEILYHHFDTTEEAYEAAQTDAGINDGDVLVIEPEKVVGLVGDFPIAVTAWAGELHALEDGDTLEGLGFNADSISMAKAAAQHCGFPLIGERRSVSEETIRADVEGAFECFDACVRARTLAEARAWLSLSRYKFEMFGYWASAWVKYNQLLPKVHRKGNPFKRAVDLAREIRSDL